MLINLGQRDKPQFFISASGSHLTSTQKSKKYKIDSMNTAIRSLQENKIILVIDDFHYLSSLARTEFIRNVKGPVFNGLGIILLSVTHRQFDALKAESELIGRFTSVTVPEWELKDLRKIAEKGFSALNINAPGNIIDKLG
jgi:hypothetical protein